MVLSANAVALGSLCSTAEVRAANVAEAVAVCIGVVRFRERSVLNVTAVVRTNALFNALRGAGRSLCNSPSAPVVPGCVYAFSLRSAANGTGVGSGSGFCAGSRSAHSAFIPAVRFCFNVVRIICANALMLFFAEFGPVAVGVPYGIGFIVDVKVAAGGAFKFCVAAGNAAGLGNCCCKTVPYGAYYLRVDSCSAFIADLGYSAAVYAGGLSCDRMR